MDSETKNYLDRSVDAVKAQNDARFAEVIAKLDAMNPVTWWQNALLLLAGIGSVIALLSFGSGRFDSGVGSMGAVIDSINAQREVNNAQDQRLERILDILGKQADAD
ncbi:hypothetical protein [Puniceibacterium antarcticum]|uniref:hypothetical protein n=1 Tax=Puniceibacterium antarcticum TaxID=1206336 RepID=UPI001C558685|nr:hypothetical protein [Puniceibacterium antarcticum]